MPNYIKNPGTCIGQACTGCSSANCYAEGGKVQTKSEHEAEGMHHSPAGGSKDRLAGSNRVKRENPQEGVHKSRSIYSPGESAMGYSVRAGDTENAKKVAYDKIKEQRPLSHRSRLSKYADGGEVKEAMDMGGDEDHELRGAMGGELMDALSRKDKKGIMDSIEAIVLSMKDRE